jgi:hypothetical protein
MKPKTRRSNKSRRRRSTKLIVDPDCWGKNKPLEQMWHDLSHFLSVVIIYKGSMPYEIVKLASHSNPLGEYATDPRVVAILSAHPDHKNAYETALYPRAKDKTVDYVITHYGDFFKRIPTHPVKTLMVPK